MDIWNEKYYIHLLTAASDSSMQNKILRHKANCFAARVI